MTIEPSIRLFGNVELAKNLVGFSKERLRVLENSMTFMGLRQDRSVTRLQPGIEIDCYICYNIKIINIYVRPVKAKEEIEGVIHYDIWYEYYWHADITGSMLESYPMAVYTDSRRRVYVIGSTKTAIANYNVFIAIYNRNGIFIAQRDLGYNTSIEFGTDIIVDPEGNIYVLFDGYSERADGYFDTILAKYSPDLSISWQRDIGILYTSVYSTGLTLSSDSVYVSGWLRDYANGPNPDRQQGWIFKFSQSNGSLSWQKRIGGYDVIGPPITNGDLTFLEDITIDAIANVYGIGRFYYGSFSIIGAPFLIKLTNAGAFSWAKHFNYTVSGKAGNYIWGINTEVVHDGVYTLCGEIDPFDSTSGDFHAIVTKFDDSGNEVANRTWTVSVPYSNSESDNDFIPRMTVDRVGNIYLLVNNFDSTQIITLVKHDPSGTFVWAKNIEHSIENIFSIPGFNVDLSGDILMFGSVDNDSDYITIKVPGSGGFIGNIGNLIASLPTLSISYNSRFTVVNLTVSDIEIKNAGLNDTESFRISNTLSYTNKTTRFLRREFVKRR